MNIEFDCKSLLNSFDLVHSQIGSDLWWEAIRTIGAPFIKELDDHNSSVLFIWQDPMGDEKKSSVASVLLDVNCLTDHHSWKPVSLHRMPGTDVWFTQLTVDSTWRASYSFIPIKANQLPDIAQKNGDGSSESQRAWWIDVATNQISDSLNRLPTLLSGWGVGSALHLPKATQELGWQEWERGELEAIAIDQLYSVKWLSSLLGNQRDCSLFSTASGNAPLVVLLDGQKWGVDSGALSVIKYLTDNNKISPAHYLLIPSINAKTRWKELSCYHDFWLSMVNDLLPKVQAELLKSDNTICDYLIAGQSLGGLSALYAGLHFPDYFSKVITLSGSFWWPDKNRMRNSDNQSSVDMNKPAENSLAAQIMSDNLSVSGLQIFQSVGLGEKNMCLDNDMTYQAIQQKGGSVHYEKMCGGHDWLSWRSGLVNGLLKLLPA